MKKIYMIGRSGCGGCQRLKEELSRIGVAFDYKNGEDASDKAWMIVNGVFLACYPALCVDGKLYEYASLFDEKGDLMVDELRGLVG